MELTILGSAASTPSYSRGLTSQLITTADSYFLVDCGEGTQRQLLRYMHPNQLDAIFITHFHGDHILGLPGLIYTMCIEAREAPLAIYGPQRIKEVLDPLIELAYDRAGFVVLPEVLEDSGIPLDEETSVFAFPVQHRIPAQGYTITQPRYMRKLVITGDTMPCKRTEQEAEGADILLHEATFLQKDKDLATLTGHSTAREVGELAKRAGVRRLLLTHISTRQKARDVGQEAAIAFKRMQTKVVNDFERFEV